MEYQYRSIKALLSDIQDDFDLTNTDWVHKAIGWIARGIEIMSIGKGLLLVSKEVCIEDYKGTLPCDISYLSFFTEGDYYLPVETRFNCCNTCDCPTGYVRGNNSVIVNPAYVQTNHLNEGSIMVHYYGVPLDDDGFPLIIDNAYVTEALSWYVVFKMITSGFKHHTIRDYREAKQNWEQAYPRAQNHINYPSVANMQSLVDNWTSTIKSNNLLTYFIR